MNLPPLGQLNPHALHTAPTDAPPYEGAPWTLQFTETAMRGPVGPRVCIEIKLMNSAEGHANASDGSQTGLMRALAAKFVPVFRADTDFEWVVAKKGVWSVNCQTKSESFGHWKFYADLDAEGLIKAADVHTFPVGAPASDDSRKRLEREESGAGRQVRARVRGRASLIPGGSTLEFLKRAFGGWGIVKVVELDGKDYQFGQPDGVPTNEGSWVVWQLSQPVGATDTVRRWVFGGAPGSGP